jgi:hypothetical protein
MTISAPLISRTSAACIAVFWSMMRSLSASKYGIAGLIQNERGVSAPCEYRAHECEAFSFARVAVR